MASEIVEVSSRKLLKPKTGTLVEVNMTMKQLAMVTLIQIVIGAPFGSAAFALGPLSAPSASEIDGKVTAALNELYSQNEAARALGAKAKAILVFPDIRKGAFIVGAQYGYGALRKGPHTAAYYRTSAASYGFQGGCYFSVDFGGTRST